ncbi:MAG: hypothetical protein IT280_12870 [Ignavibacteria bacterium]|nr:hypothetical protein [Ignavibacteria bacterium]
MALRLSKIWTLGKALYHMTMRLREYTDQTITPQGWAEIINLKIPQAQAVLNLKNSEEYKEPIVITPSEYTAGGKWDSEVTYVPATKQLTVTNTGFANYFSVDFINFITTNPVGARVFMFPDFSATGIFEAYVKKVISANTVELSEGIPDDILTVQPGLMVIPGNSSTVNLALLSIYKNIREIVLIESNVYGECVSKPKTEFLNITKPPLGSYHSHWLKRIIWCRDGELLKFGKGTLTEFGTLTAWINRIPYECDINYPDEYLDARDEDMNIIFDMCLLTGLETLKIPIPENLKSTEAEINKLIQANEAQKAKLLTGKE